MRHFTMERINFFLSPQQPCAAPVADDMGGLPHADRQCHEHGADSHGEDDECDRTQFELDGGTGPDGDRPGIQLTEITVEEDPDADEENGGEQSEHRSRPWFWLTPFSGSWPVGRQPVLRSAVRPGW